MNKEEIEQGARKYLKSQGIDNPSQFEVDQCCSLYQSLLDSGVILPRNKAKIEQLAKDLKLNFRSRYEYVKSLQDNFGLDDEECSAFLWIIEMWDRKQNLPQPTEFKLMSESPLSSAGKEVKTSGNVYVKLPVEVEAIQFNGENEIQIMDFVGHKLDVSKHPGRRYEDLPNESAIIKIQTLEGDLNASKMDYIVKGYSKDLGYHFWPVKPDYFEQNYRLKSNQFKSTPSKEISDQEIEEFAMDTVGNEDGAGWGIITGAKWVRDQLKQK